MSTPPTRSTAVDFAGPSRLHVALPVRDLELSRKFYETLLGVPPTKVRDGYVKFEAAAPSVNLTLNATAEAVAHHPTSHFGVQVKSTEAVLALHGQLRAAGFATASEEGVTCCFAVQDKVWAIDPEGHRWEVFVVLEADAEVHSAPPKELGDEERLLPKGEPVPCCAP
ncbi:MAG: ArsI/CadI family heavy metal resistance metalloenzyme [Myxococcota bacterium]